MYATAQTMIDRFGEREMIQLTDRATPPTGAVDQAVLAAALADAASLIHGYVAGRYAVPLSPVPPLAVRLQADIARFYLMQGGPGAVEAVQKAFDSAVATLRDVSRGAVVLEAGGVQPQDAPTTVGQPQDVLLEAAPRVFGSGGQGWGW